MLTKDYLCNKLIDYEANIYDVSKRDTKTHCIIDE